MLLAIDAGNSTVQFGFFRDGSLVQQFTAQSREEATADEYAAFLLAAMSGSGMDESPIEGVALSSVVPSLVHVIFQAVRRFTDATPLLVSSRLRLPISIKYGTPETLGSDRIASASAAYKLFGGPVIVADFGTATTVSVVDRQGDFLGGMIAPGLMTGYKALLGRASGLPRVGLTYPKDAVGTTTAEGIQSGVIFGHADMAAGLIRRAMAEAGEAKVAVTGGLAGMVLPHLGMKAQHDPALALKGLEIIYKINTEN